MTKETLAKLQAMRGLVATCVTTGTVDPDYAQAREDMRAWNIEHGYRAVEYRTFHCVLVESGRDGVVSHALEQGYDWVLQIDADAAPFTPDALQRLLVRAYVDIPESDVVGAYCQLKQAPFLPTIDTGTGTWEPHFPGEGVLEVIRTGGHFLLAKTQAFRRFPAPWFRTRIAPRAIDTLTEFDNLARQRLHGDNPFARTPAWGELMEWARANAGGGPSAVGEDSGFCDQLRAAGGRIFVDTDLVAGHVSRTYITPDMLRGQMQARESAIAARCGVLA